MTSSIQKNYLDLKDRITKTALKFERDPANIEIVAVSKFHSIEAIKEAYNLGIKNFGESYIQEWKMKASSPELAALEDLKWHLIGPIQANKVKFINSQIFCIQSLESFSIAEKIEKKLPTTDNKINILIQLKVDNNETQKHGISYNDSIKLCEFIAKSKKISLHGFMGIGPTKFEYNQLKELYNKFYQNANSLWKDYSENNTKKCVLSFGMSDDFEIAIECGSNMLRIGSAIFGTRNN